MYNEKGEFYKPDRGSAASPDHIMISFCGDPHTSMAVSWRTDISVTGGYVEYFESGTEDKKIVTADFQQLESDIDISNFYSAAVKNLKPGTKYFYTCGDEKNRSDEFYFETEPENLEKFKFVILADHQQGNPWPQPDYTVVSDLLKQATREHPDIRFIFTVGDNCDNGQNEIQWNGMFEGLKGHIEHLPYMMTTGNHDNRGFATYLPEPVGKFYLEHADFFDAQFKGAYPYNGPKGYETENYSFDYGNVHFCVLGINAPELVAPWAEKDIESSDKTWKINSYHFPIYPVMPEGQNDDAYPWLRGAMEKADIVFAGHEHSFARSFPIKGDEMFDRPCEGTVHYIAGNSGENIFCTNEQKVWHSAFFPQEEPIAIYTLVEVDGKKMTVTACTNDGRIADQFTIDKENDIITPYALAPIYRDIKMAYKGSMLQLCARGLAPEEKHGIWYAPFGAVVQYIGGLCVKEKNKITLGVYGKTATFTLGSDIALTSDGEKKMSGALYVGNRGQLYMPAFDAAEIFGMRCKYIERNNYLDFEHASEDKPLTAQDIS